MKNSLTKLQRNILLTASHEPGQTIAQFVKGFSAYAASTIRLNIYKLCALGFLYLRDGNVVYTTESGKRIAGNEPMPEA